MPRHPSNTIISGAAKGRAPDRIIHLQISKVSQICAELDTDQSNDLSDAGAEKMATKLDQPEKKIANGQARMMEGLRSKAEAAHKLLRFEYDSI
ncbi:hypothetical protein [Bradyrhizobium sp. SZCCHNS2015]|uniref:hypothetical protein n=1 Tax=Bradyrhizobium sp. SZCCHNS2015 TaxID=3057305 RepID=UPI0028F0CFC0|nr:hypothetical protein [Bradyrhizobium sp. SZCCHNS2015]